MRPRNGRPKWRRANVHLHRAGTLRGRLQWRLRIARQETPLQMPCTYLYSPPSLTEVATLPCDLPARPLQYPLRRLSQILIHFSEIKITIRYLSRKYRSAANKRAALHAPGKEKGISFRNESRGFPAPEPCCAAETFGPANGILRPRAIKNRPVSERILPGFCGAFLV